MDCPWNPEGVNEICESPIERMLVGGLIALDSGGHANVRFLIGKSRAEELPSMRDRGKYPGLWLHVFPQEVVGPYRADFLIVAGLNGRCKTMVIECDGKEFHQDKERDWERDNFMERLTYRVIRFKGSAIWRDTMRCAQYVVEVADRYLGEPEQDYQPNQQPLHPADALKPLSTPLLGALPMAYWNWLAANSGDPPKEPPPRPARPFGEGVDYE